ncbi:MAG: aminoacyl--tRNA ligase-related protein [Candidatus Moranbacteria bacterium]|jgi:prolyl-tRNA synthetase|nr:aminoacyl--tRNA ligase-related protein [Candidatus Moranbacteria bacterium]
MKQSKLFTKTSKDFPKDEVSKNAQLLIKAGFIHKEMAGVYTFLPLGLRVLNKVNDIIRDEMDKVGGQEVFMTVLQPQERWEKTGRWNDEVVDNWFKTKLKNGSEVGMAFTHEEAITNYMQRFISSYKDLPFYAYQIQEKFRNEARAKSGIMRGREFLMKDLYSFSRSKEEHDKFYEEITQAYLNVFNRAGIGEKTYLTFASGGTFSKYSHEFQTVSEAGEDIVYIDKEKNIAINEEVFNDEVLADLGVKRENLIQEKSIEVGNIFSLGYKFSEALELTYKNEEGKSELVYMGSYGIGPSRLMGTIVELLSDEKGIVWPESVAPFAVHLISLNKDEEAQKIYDTLTENNIEVLFDDRDVRAGEKFADSDLIGIPYRVVISDRSIEAGGVEFKKRNSTESEIIKIEELLGKIKK